jgi:hypothetical protein
MLGPARTTWLPGGLNDFILITRPITFQSVDREITRLNSPNPKSSRKWEPLIRTGAGPPNSRVRLKPADYTPPALRALSFDKLRNSHILPIFSLPRRGSASSPYHGEAEFNGRDHRCRGVPRLFIIVKGRGAFEDQDSSFQVSLRRARSHDLRTWRHPPP